MRSIIQRLMDRRGVRVFRYFFILCISLTFASTAWVSPAVASLDPDQEDSDELDLESETDEEKKAREEADRKRMSDDDSLDLLDDEDELDSLEGEEPTEENTKDLLEGEIDGDAIGGEGEDSSAIYRDAQAKLGRMIPDEEMIAWEQYLQQYPNSLFKSRIEKRMEELEAILYDQLIDNDDPERLDADKRELLFAQGLNLETLNPRTRVLAAFEWGLPNYMNLVADYEHQILRELSVHGGIRQRHTGWNFEAGTRWAMVKSSRTETLFVLIMDLRLNFEPTFLGVRPQLGFGQKFGKFDVQLQFGADFELRPQASPRLISGLNVTYHAAEQVSVFTETTFLMSNFGSKYFDDFFRFNLVSFGMKFYPKIDGIKPRSLEINVGANIPYTSSYWMFHFGAVTGQVSYYL